MTPSPELLAELDALRFHLRAQRGEDVGSCYVLITEEEAFQLASGYVPNAVISKCRLILSESDGTRDRQRADVPVRAVEKKRKTR